MTTVMMISTMKDEKIMQEMRFAFVSIDFIFYKLYNIFLLTFCVLSYLEAKSSIVSTQSIK